MKYFLSVLFLLFFIVGCKKHTPSTDTKYTISLSASSLSLETTDTTTLLAQITSGEFSLQDIVWHSTDTTIVKVTQDGFVSAIGAGTADIWAIAPMDSAMCGVTISPVSFVCGGVSSINAHSGVVYKNAQEYFFLDTTSTEIYFNTLAVCDGVIYTAGSVVGGNGANSYVWANGRVLYSMSKGANISALVPVQTSRGVNIYSVGSVYENYSSSAAIWDGSMKLTLVKSSGESSINDAVYGTDKLMYCGGYMIGAEMQKVAVVWAENNQSILSSDILGSEVQAMCLDEKKVMAAGYVGDSAVVWTNGVIDTLSSGGVKARVSDITFDGQNTYVVGFITSDDGVQSPVMWENGVMQKLSTKAGIANGVAVSQGKIYVVGKVYGTNYIDAVMWVNGVEVSLTDQTSNSTANDIVVW